MELLEFLGQTQREIKDQVLTRGVDSIDEGVPFPELIYTEIVTRHMADIGMTFDEPELCNYSAKVGTANVRLTAFALSEEENQLDLFVSLYKGTEELVAVPDSETTKAAEQCLRFLTLCVEGKLSSKMDESHEAYMLAKIIEDNYNDLEQIRIYILTDGQVKTRSFKPREVSGKIIKLEAMDIVRLFNHWQEGKPRDELVVNFEEISGASLPCVWVANEMAGYDYAMTAVPGEALRYIYEKYGARALEANVRSFLSQTGKVNKGISTTLRDQPERFMAYNNGIVMVADEVRLGKTSDGGTGISWLKGLQIVNGGQTTASIFFTKKKFPATDLKQVRVPAKLIVLKKADSAQEAGLIADIAKYANSQNKVNMSDLSANRPFHIAMEKLAMATYCPDGYSRWFYERATGSYKVLLEREGKTLAGIKRLQDSMPLTRKITKTELAKYLCAWRQRPDLVSLGGQKNFAAFMQMVDSADSASADVPTVDDYKEMIAQIIIFKTAHKIVRSTSKAFQANVAAYTVSTLAKLAGGKVDLMQIWSNQEVSQQLSASILTLAQEVDAYLHQTANGRMISEWAKRSECWETLSTKQYSVDFQNIPELL